MCTPPFALGRVAILLLGSHTFRYLAILLLVIAVVLQTGATSSVKAIKMSEVGCGKGPVRCSGWGTCHRISAGRDPMIPSHRPLSHTPSSLLRKDHWVHQRPLV